MFRAILLPQNRKRTIIFFALFLVLMIAAGIIGLNDNPPGIFLAYFSAASFVLIFVHYWKSPIQFLKLMGYSAVLFVLTVLIHNFGEVLAVSVSEMWLLHGILVAIHVSAFLIAVLLCPSAILIGAIGAVITSLKKSSR